MSNVCFKVIIWLKKFWKVPSNKMYYYFYKNKWFWVYVEPGGNDVAGKKSAQLSEVHVNFVIYIHKQINWIHTHDYFTTTNVKLNTLLSDAQTESSNMLELKT